MWNQWWKLAYVILKIKTLLGKNWVIPKKKKKKVQTDNGFPFPYQWKTKAQKPS